MKKAEILNNLGHEYSICFSVYASYLKQAEMFLEKGDTAAWQRMTERAANRSATLHGIKRAAMALNISETELLDAAGFNPEETR